jgi:hypothetical protein
MRNVDGNGEQTHYVKRVLLPSGKTIEVVYFDDPAADAVQMPGQTQDLHLCPDCDSVLVFPTQWSEVDRMQWEVTLRCPNCEWSGTGVFEQDTVERFDEELDRGTEALVRDLKRMMQANMEDEIDRFVIALQADHIVPEDF